MRGLKKVMINCHLKQPVNLSQKDSYKLTFNSGFNIFLSQYTAKTYPLSRI